MSKNICPVCHKEFKRLMRHIGEKHPPLYASERDKVTNMFENGMSLREIGSSDDTFWSFGAALSELIKANTSADIIRDHQTKKISDKLKIGYSLGNYNIAGRGRKNKKNIISNSIKAHPTEILKWQEKLLIKKNIIPLSDIEIGKLKIALVDYVKSCDFLSYNYSLKELDKDFNNLVNGQISFDGGAIKNISSSGSKIYRYFFPNILKVKGLNKPSIYDAINDEKILRKIISNRLDKNILNHYSGNITKNMIIQGAKASGNAFSASQFKPLIAKYIYNEFVKDGDNILDYSCGFGSRLLGLMATKKKAQYFGYEPNIETYNGLINMAKYFDFPINIKMCGSEEELFDNKFNFIFSSPPYFDTEKYSDNITQCYNCYPEYNEWLDKYWKKTINNIKQMMAPEAVFAINAGNDGNEKMKKLDSDMNRIIIECGFEAARTIKILTPMSHLANKSGKYKIKNEYVYFYRLIK